MLRFLFDLFWKTFVLMFVAHLVSHWSELQGMSKAFKCNLETKQECQKHYVAAGWKLADFLQDALVVTFSNVIDVVRATVFVAKLSVTWLKSRATWNQEEL